MKLTDAVRGYLRGSPAHTFTPSPETQCTFVRGNGVRCKLKPVPGSDRCVFHPPKM
jgi:hypothetical protein